MVMILFMESPEFMAVNESTIFEFEDVFSIFDNLRVVGRKDECRAEIVPHLFHQRYDLQGRDFVEIGCRFVCQHQFCPGDESPGHGHSLFLSSGNLPWIFVSLVRHADGCQHCFNLFPALRSRPVLDHQQRVFYVFKYGQYRDQVKILKDETDMGTTKLGGFSAVQSAYILIDDAQRAA